MVRRKRTVEIPQETYLAVRWKVTIGITGGRTTFGRCFIRAQGRRKEHRDHACASSRPRPLSPMPESVVRIHGDARQDDRLSESGVQESSRRAGAGGASGAGGRGHAAAAFRGRGRGGRRGRQQSAQDCAADQATLPPASSAGAAAVPDDAPPPNSATPQAAVAAAAAAVNPELPGQGTGNRAAGKFVRQLPRLTNLSPSQR